MTYEEYRNSRQQEFNSLPIFFAFGKEQFKQEMEKRGLTENDTDKIYRLSSLGGFYLKSDAPIIKAFMEKKDPLPDLMNDPAFAEDAFYYEMCNHEYGINWQGDWDVYSCFGNCKYAEDKSGVDYLRENGYSEDVIRSYIRARKRYYKAAEENDWF